MWGQAQVLGKNQCAARIIPTRVGTSCARLTHSQHLAGSSPRVWGQENINLDTENVPRIIPTRVGTRFRTRVLLSISWDHPHACGDKHLSVLLFTCYRGSSPRVWGQGQVVLDRLKKERIIPTRVGTSMRRYFINGNFRDHPHACGDKTKEIKENSGFAKSTA